MTRRSLRFHLPEQYAALTFHRNSAASEMIQAGHPRKASTPRRSVTPAISATAQAFTESRNAAIELDWRNRNAPHSYVASVYFKMPCVKKISPPAMRMKMAPRDAAGLAYEVISRVRDAVYAA